LATNSRKSIQILGTNSVKAVIPVSNNILSRLSNLLNKENQETRKNKVRNLEERKELKTDAKTLASKFETCLEVRANT
jgi:hypothetical protein